MPQGLSRPALTKKRKLPAGVNLGLGVGSAKGAWDVRTVYSVLLGSDNAEGDFLVAAGFSF